MLDVTEMAALLGTSMRTIFIWHWQGQLKPHRYNDFGAYLYEVPETDSPLRNQHREYQREKSANQLVHATNNEVQYEAQSLCLFVWVHVDALRILDQLPFQHLCIINLD